MCYHNTSTWLLCNTIGDHRWKYSGATGDPTGTASHGETVAKYGRVVMWLRHCRWTGRLPVSTSSKRVHEMILDSGWHCTSMDLPHNTQCHGVEESKLRIWTTMLARWIINTIYHTGAMKSATSRCSLQTVRPNSDNEVWWSAQGWTYRTLAVHERVNSQFLVLPGSLLIFTPDYWAQMF